MKKYVVVLGAIFVLLLAACGGATQAEPAAPTAIVQDFYLCHFLLHLDPTPTAARLRLSLIDLHRAQVRARTPARWRDKDLAALHFSALGIGLTQRDLLRFLAVYFARPLRSVLRDEAPLLARLAQAVPRLQERYVRKFASPGAR